MSTKEKLFQSSSGVFANGLFAGKTHMLQLMILLSYGDDADIDLLGSCNYGKANTRLLVHAVDAAINRATHILIKIEDTVIVVFAIEPFSLILVKEL